jgi:predicted permease
MLSVVDDLRFGIRLLFSRLGLTSVAVITFALGISVTTATFSVLATMYWKAFPGVSDPGRLVELETVASDGSMVRGSWSDYREYRGPMLGTAKVAAHIETTLLMGPPEHPKPIGGELVSSSYFEVLGVSAALGRVLSSREDADEVGSNPIAVISDRVWRNDFGARPDVLGKTIRVNRHELTIIGVTPPAFRGPFGPGFVCDLWVPFAMGVELGVIDKSAIEVPSMRLVYMFARLDPGIRLSEARTRMGTVARNIAAAHPKTHRGFGATLEPMWRCQLHGRAAFLPSALVLMAVSLLVLLIACANVANLLLAHSVARMREFGVRVALGAGRCKLASLLLTHTLLLASASAVFALPLAMWMTDSTTSLLPNLARATSIPIGMDWRVFAFAGAMCIAAALVSSTAPLLFIFRTDVNEIVREGGGRSGRAGTRSHGLRGALIVSEVALAQVVLVGTGLFFRSYQNVIAVDIGFERRGVLLATFPIANAGYSIQDLESFCVRLRERLVGATPVEQVSYADYAPLWANDGPYTAAEPEGFIPRHPEDAKVHGTSVAPGYFDLLRIPILEGRDFSERDLRPAPPVMIVNQAFAMRFYDGASPVGRRVKIRGNWVTVVGLVRDSKYFSFTDKPGPHFYLPFRQSYRLGQRIVFFVRTTGDPEAVVPILRSLAGSIDPNATSLKAAPLEEFNEGLLVPQKIAASLLSALGVIAFLLASVGLYGLTAYSVGQRTQELGIRMALGARPHEVITIIMRRGMILTATGIAIGVGLAVGLMRIVEDLLVGVSTLDALAFGSAAVFLTLVSMLASYIPARKATRLDPFAALRAE